MSSESSPILRFSGIGKQFPGTVALDQVSFDVYPGEVVTLLGENGAGKSTLMKILSGVWPTGTYDGQLFLAGDNGLSETKFSSTREALSAGISMIHQELSVFGELSVGENLEIDALPPWIRYSELHERVQKFLDHFKLPLRSEDRVSSLSIGKQQLVEIARALYRKARVLVFDEPTSALSESEVQILYGVIEELKKRGNGILYITHRMDEVFRISDRIVVLRDGKFIHDFKKDKPRTELEPALLKSMVGRELKDVYPARNKKIEDVCLEVKDLTLTDLAEEKALLKNVSFELRRGEVLGLAGLLGAGRSETLLSLFGVFHPSGPFQSRFDVKGSVKVKGNMAYMASPRGSIEDRKAFVSEDRKASGLVLHESILFNFSLPSLTKSQNPLTKTDSLFSWVSSSTEKELGEKWFSRLKLKYANAGQPVQELSGGNQQKVVLAKWLVTEPAILLLDEPTRGVDVGAKAEIYKWIAELSSQGIAILLASSELPELLGLCHKIIVLREGAMSGSFEAEKTHQEELIKAACL